MSKDWLSFMGAEEMDSVNQYQLISLAVRLAKELTDNAFTVLSVGCADGTEMELFGGDVKGIDLNDVSLQKCTNKGLDVQKMDMHKMTFPDNSFDLVFSKDNFEHALTPIHAIEEFARVTSKYVCIVLPDESWQSDGRHLIIPTMRQMIALGEKAGLALKSYREYNIIVNNICTVTSCFYLFQKL